MVQKKIFLVLTAALLAVPLGTFASIGLPMVKSSIIGTVTAMEYVPLDLTDEGLEFVYEPFPPYWNVTVQIEKVFDTKFPAGYKKMNPNYRDHLPKSGETKAYVLYPYGVIPKQGDRIEARVSGDEISDIQEPRTLIDRFSAGTTRTMDWIVKNPWAWILPALIILVAIVIQFVLLPWNIKRAQRRLAATTQPAQLEDFPKGE